MVRKFLDQGTIERITDLFKVLSDTTRVSILALLKDQELSVTEIAEALGMEQSAVSHQLAILKNARLVTFRREKRSKYYRPDDAHIYEIIQQVIDHVNE
ncbi:MAG TPA: metalloregulator ArsR/SmtB family transcription factor [Haloplasmataceae bacterium]